MLKYAIYMNVCGDVPRTSVNVNEKYTSLH